MISRLYILPKIKDSREKIYMASWRALGIKGKVSSVQILDSYTIDSDLEDADLQKIGRLFSNPNIEEFFLNELPSKIKFKNAIEIGFLPGVTDNIGNTALETLYDFFQVDKNTNWKVYTSKIFLIKGSLTKIDLEKIVFSLHNPLIESSAIINNGSLSIKVPKVILETKELVKKVSLKVSDEELEKIGKEGILDENGRRGPLALDLDSMKVIQKYFFELGRDPTDIEIESLAQTWSEHCKHTIFANPIDEITDGLYRTYIKGSTKIIRQKKGKEDFCVSVFSDNSGAIDFDDEYLITHKVETHNSPSALDPFGGAITGIGGVNRDAIGFGKGAKPIANTFGFCVGNPNDTRSLYKGKNKTQKMLPTKRILDGVVKGINVGGNCSGIPTVSGFIKYEDRYRGKPLVFAGTIGIIPKKINGKNSYEKEAQVDDYVVMVGGRVGADGIHGATFSSVTMDSNSPATAVQIGDPITQKKLSDALVKEARDMDLYNSITDNGAGGLSCSVAEMAKECGGAEVHIEKIPLKYEGLTPWEIWISESQERMTLAVPKKKWEVFKKLMDSRGVEATIIGEFNNSGKCIVYNNDKKIMDISMDFLHDGLPEKDLKTTYIQKIYKEPQLPKNSNRTKLFEKLVGELNIGSFAYISEQYDHEVQSSSVLKPISGEGRINTDAQVLKPLLNSKKGAVVSSSLYPFYGDISTYDMSACAIDTAIRNIICAGGDLNTLALLDNFCWCSSNEEFRLGQLKDAVKACYDYSIGYNTPFISGKDSMFNDFKGYDENENSIKISIPPTLLISAISVTNDISKTISPEFKEAGDCIYLLGDTDQELGASEYYRMLANEAKDIELIGNNVPKVDWKKNSLIYNLVQSAISKELLSSAISIHSGGLAIALAKSCVGGMIGAKISLKDFYGNAVSPDEKIFSESQGRILVSIDPKKAKIFEKHFSNISCKKIGNVSKDKKVVVLETNNKKFIDTDIVKLKKAYHRFSNTQ
ncbi:MAG: phosphoribosylformylglycinamidine synthase [Candidatus Pacebacteria bacterium]|nr:phosphoribosylformylglycinamidine synthase [Candidatus Paceibacterota bacterium]MCF7863060.1 phosphoribosylformylglycinamidine synthase [Candidatus Paceibacterota bacterium]